MTAGPGNRTEALERNCRGALERRHPVSPVPTRPQVPTHGVRDDEGACATAQAPTTATPIWPAMSHGRMRQITGSIHICALGQQTPAEQSAQTSVLVILIGGDDQGELATIVDLGDLDLQLLSHRDDVLDGLDTLAIVELAHLRDVQQTVLAGQQ